MSAAKSRIVRLVIRLGNAAKNPDLAISDAWSLLQEAHEELQRISMLNCEPMQVIAVSSIIEATNCPDIKGVTGDYLTDILMRNVRDYIHGT
jgi:hypothetical protein